MSEMNEIVESNDIVVKRGPGRPRKEIDNETEIKPKGPKGRPRKEVEPVPRGPRGRPRLENPCTSGKPKAGRQYLKDYYLAKLQNCLINCPKCNSLTEKINIGNHMKSKHCTKVANFISMSA